MYIPLGEERLKSGERLRLGVVECPDEDWSERIAPFLGHKGPDTREQIRRGLAGPLDRLRTLFYVGEVEDRLITEVMVVGDRAVGILGHVFTLPEERRKGAFSVLMQAQMADMPRARFRLLCLGTGFDTPPYWIYHSFGFRSIGLGRGQMIWRAAPDVEEELFAPGPASVRRMRWDDWSWIDLLGMQPVAPDDSLPRSACLGLKGQGSLEGPFVSFQLQREKDPRMQALALETHAGATAGFALLAPDRRWFGDFFAADLYLHPAFRGSADELLARMPWPEDPCVCTTSAPGPYDEAWERAGFRRVATLPSWLEHEGKRRDICLWRRD